MKVDSIYYNTVYVKYSVLTSMARFSRMAHGHTARD